jgi:hypothetical protein
MIKKKRPLKKFRKDNIKMEHTSRRIECEGVDWIEQPQRNIQWLAFINTAIN